MLKFSLSGVSLLSLCRDNLILYTRCVVRLTVSLRVPPPLWILKWVGLEARDPIPYKEKPKTPKNLLFCGSIYLFD